MGTLPGCFVTFGALPQKFFRNFEWSLFFFLQDQQARRGRGRGKGRSRSRGRGTYFTPTSFAEKKPWRRQSCLLVVIHPRRPLRHLSAPCGSCRSSFGFWQYSF